MKAIRNDNGAVLVEFALVLLPLLLLIFGFLQFGLATNAEIDATHLTAEGARYVAVDQNPGDPNCSTAPCTPGSMQAYISSRADTAFLQQASVCIAYPSNTAKSPPTSGTVGDPVRVTMTQTYPLLPIVSNQLGILALNVKGEATMRLEAVPDKIAANSGGCP